jgi:hypothetical protein
MALNANSIVKRYLKIYDELSDNPKLQEREDGRELQPYIAMTIVATLAAQDMTAIAEQNIVTWVYHALDRKPPAPKKILHKK